MQVRSMPIRKKLKALGLSCRRQFSAAIKAGVALSDKKLNTVLFINAVFSSS